MMTASELSDKLNYTGMVKDLRRLAMDEKMAKPEEIAVMTTFEVCELIVERYAVVYTEPEEIGLVEKDRLDEYSAMLKRIMR